MVDLSHRHIFFICSTHAAVSYRGLFTAGWFGVREKHCSRLEIYDRLRASEQADGIYRLCLRRPLHAFLVVKIEDLVRFQSVVLVQISELRQHSAILRNMVELEPTTTRGHCLLFSTKVQRICKLSYETET